MSYTKKHLTWNDIHTIIDDVVLRLSSYQFDAVVGIMRGGLIPATLISYKLNIPLIAYGVSSYVNDTQQTLREYQPMSPNIREMRSVLVVDDISDTGTTLLHTISTIRAMSPDCNVITAALIAKEQTLCYPQFYQNFYDKNTWVVFPWES